MDTGTHATLVRWRFRFVLLRHCSDKMLTVWSYRGQQEEAARCRGFQEVLGRTLSTLHGSVCNREVRNWEASSKSLWDPFALGPP